MEVFFRNKGEKFKGGNPWGGISLDDNTGILYVTTGNPANYFIGVDRPGLNEYTNSVIAIDINKRKNYGNFKKLPMTYGILTFLLHQY